MCWAIVHELGTHACQVAVKHTPCVQKEMSGLYGTSERGSNDKGNLTPSAELLALALATRLGVEYMVKADPDTIRARRRAKTQHEKNALT